ncbi:MAG: hypothetical protein ACRD72_03600 [Candidatus Angelobacter sp.]|jgi:hypothetical protein|nr:hypothetical protein [Candidatus Limnocylindrales bacterium]
MKLEREVIIDLLPAYFSGEASAATRTLVEDFFRENPDFEKSARSAAGPLESLKAAPPRIDPEKEKLALERARMVTETRSSFFWLAVISTLMLFLFRIQNGKIIWIVWSGSASGSGSRGPLFIAMAVFFWVFYFYSRTRTSPLPAHTKFLWMATFYSLLTGIFKIENHKIVWVLFHGDPSAGIFIAAFAAALWGIYFIQRWQFKRTNR